MKIKLCILLLLAVLQLNGMEESRAQDNCQIPRLTLLSALILDKAEVPTNVLPIELIEFMNAIEQIKSTNYYTQSDKQILLNALANGNYNEAKHEILTKDVYNGEYKSKTKEFLLNLIENPAIINEEEIIRFKRAYESRIISQVVRRNHIHLLTFLHSLNFNISMFMPKFMGILITEQTITYAARTGNDMLMGFLLTNLKIDTKSDRFIAIDLADINRTYQNEILLNEQNNAGLTPLMYAVRRNDIEMTKMLIGAGANVNGDFSRINNIIDPILTQALKSNCTDIENESMVKLLLDVGAVIDAKDRNSQTALMIARKKGFKKIEQLLLKNGAK